MGKIKDAHGLRGELFVLLFAKEAPWLASLKRVALASSDAGPFQSFDVAGAQVHKEGLILRLKGLHDRTQAEALRGLLFYIPAELLISHDGDTIFLREIEDFQVTNRGEFFGRICGFSSNGPQDLLIVEKEGRKTEIPFVEAFLLEIDFSAKTVRMDLPEGLWGDDE